MAGLHIAVRPLAWRAAASGRLIQPRSACSRASRRRPGVVRSEGRRPSDLVDCEMHIVARVLP